MSFSLKTNFLLLLLVVNAASCGLFKKENTESEKPVPVPAVATEQALSNKAKSEQQAQEQIEAQIQAQLSKLCLDDLKKLPGEFSLEKITKVCSEVKQVTGCNSAKNIPIYHYDKKAQNHPSIKVLVFALIHGDETMGGSVTRKWMERLSDLEPRNAWRIIPILNPDGRSANTRTNANGVDLNRNFPTEHWDKEARLHWVKAARKDKRKFPGKMPASEPETLCAMKQINEYKPDLIIAVHTPLGMLDFDGPKVKYPKGASLPWLKLGHYPGSLGRYMWRDNKTPVLTIELKGSDFINDIGKIDKLQDISGLLAIMATKEIEKSKDTMED